jgi:hypothetical protein
MHGFTSGIIEQVVRAVDTSRVKLAADIGGASGTLVHSLMTANRPRTDPRRVPTINREGRVSSFQSDTNPFTHGRDRSDREWTRMMNREWTRIV